MTREEEVQKYLRSELPIEALTDWTVAYLTEARFHPGVRNEAAAELASRCISYAEAMNLDESDERTYGGEP